MRRHLAPATAAPRLTAACAGYPGHSYAYPANAAAATSAATGATDAAAAASASRTASAASTASATAASPRDQHAATDVFIVDEMEGGEADVGEFFFIERHHRARREARPLLNVARRHG
jgi:D-serine deaminase-like pyridoxal phosphate-dependent protein